eukprot:scaffold1942_cov351-Prasinococcus_capsulatus_cf.AAC.9
MVHETMWQSVRNIGYLKECAVSRCLFKMTTPAVSSAIGESAARRRVRVGIHEQPRIAPMLQRYHEETSRTVNRPLPVVCGGRVVK